MTTRIHLNAQTAILGKYANRHGLIAGATGTGKTVTLQKLCQEFSTAGVPVFVADVKGDIAGLAMPARTITSPVHLFDVFGEQGAKLTLSLESLGPDLLARLLELTDAQKGVLEAIFATAHRKIETLVDLVDQLNRFEGQAGTVAAVHRALLRFERLGGDQLIGKTCFNIEDLFLSRGTEGFISVLAADRLMMSPVIYSTLMIWLLDQLFERMPEAGDLDAPRFVMFIDEAHLLFQDAPDALVQKLERTVRLIRSKGVAIYFVTQSPDDLPDTILRQLGNRIQHRMSAATVRDQRAIRAAAETMPQNPAVNAAEAIGKLAVGEALVSVIGADGAPQPCQRTRIELPHCRLGALSRAERDTVANNTRLSLSFGGQAWIDESDAMTAAMMSKPAAPQMWEGIVGLGLVAGLIGGIVMMF